jgi:hypothetical protein
MKRQFARRDYDLALLDEWYPPKRYLKEGEGLLGGSEIGNHLMRGDLPSCLLGVILSKSTAPVCPSVVSLSSILYGAIYPYSLRDLRWSWRRYLTGK